MLDRDPLSGTDTSAAATDLLPRHTSPDTAGAAVRVLTLAFTADPVIRWLFPDPDAYLKAFPTLVTAIAGGASLPGTVDLVAGDAGDAGAALWLPPGTELPEEDMVEILSRYVPPTRQEAAAELLEQLDSHHPADLHWYLPFVGVDPSAQGCGHGSTLLRTGLARADDAGLPAYLEASSPRNRRLYERHGFQVRAELTVADSPPLWPMVHPAGPTGR